MLKEPDVQPSTPTAKQLPKVPAGLGLFMLKHQMEKKNKEKGGSVSVNKRPEEFMDDVYGGLSLRLGFSKPSALEKVEKQYEGCKRKFAAACASKRKQEEEKARLGFEELAMAKKASAVFM